MSLMTSSTRRILFFLSLCPIATPVQTADPDNQGGDRLDLGVGLNSIWTGNHRVSLEYETTINQDVNGVQMEMESMLTLGYQLAFE